MAKHVDTAPPIERESPGNDIPAEPATYRSLRQYWHPVAYGSEVGAGPLLVTLLGQRIVLARLGGELRAFDNVCPHRGAPLSEGEVVGDRLRCAYHGWEYDCNGVCRRVPATASSPIEGNVRLDSVRVAESAGLIWISLVPEPTFGLPEFPQHGDPDFRVVELPVYEWNCSVQRRTENVVDLAHFPWLHDGVLGVRDCPEVPEIEVRRVGGELRMELEAVEPTGTIRTTHTATDAEAIKGYKQYRMFMPHTVLNEHGYPNGNLHTGYWAFCPIGPRRTRCFMQFARNYDKDEAHDASAIDFASLVNEQDRKIVEGQYPQELPGDLSAEMYVRGADQVTIEYRRWMIELARSHQTAG